MNQISMVDASEPLSSPGASSSQRSGKDRRRQDRRDASAVCYEKGRYIFRQHEVGDHAFILESGKVEIVLSINSEDKVIGVLGPGDLFGEMALIDNGLRMASARVVDDSASVYAISREDFQRHLSSCNPFVGKLVNILTANVRSSNQFAFDLVDSLTAEDDLEASEESETATQPSHTRTS